jgi:polysaccharide export outer membrane protein
MMRGFLLGLLMALGFLVPATAAVAQSAGYVLGPDDAIQVIVYGQPEVSITTRIKSDGTIVMPLIGSVRAEGQTNVALAKAVGDKLVQGGFLKDPVVNIEIQAYVSKFVNVAGQVVQPQIVPLDRPYRALEVLLKAGWVRETGANYVYLRRPGSPEQRLALEDLVRGTADKDPLLQPGDTLFVPNADTFFITGAINRPGSFQVLPGMTVRQALAVSGGVSPTGSSNKVGLIRDGGKERDADMTQTLQKNDVIIVKERLF